MIKSATALEATTAKILAVDLLPRFYDWRDYDVANPALGYRIKLRVTIREDVVNGYLWVPADIEGDSVSMLGCESDTAPIPKFDRSAAAPEVAIDGHVAIDEDGHPVVAAKEPGGTSHWAVCRFVPCRGGAALKLTGVIAIPKVVPEGPAKDSFAVDSKGTQSVSLSCEDWEVTIVATKAASAGFRTVASDKGAKVPEFARD